MRRERAGTEGTGGSIGEMFVGKDGQANSGSKKRSRGDEPDRSKKKRASETDSSQEDKVNSSDSDVVEKKPVKKSYYVKKTKPRPKPTVKIPIVDRELPDLAQGLDLGLDEDDVDDTERSNSEAGSQVGGWYSRFSPALRTRDICAVPRKELIAVELPYVISGDSLRERRRKVYKVMGGKPEVCSRVGEGKDFKVYLQPESVLEQSYIESSKKSTCSVAVKFVRKRKTGQLVSSQIVGYIDSYHKFESMADFCYRKDVPGTTLDLGDSRLREREKGLEDIIENKEMLAASRSEARASLHLPPAFFSEFSAPGMFAPLQTDNVSACSLSQLLSGGTRVFKAKETAGDDKFEEVLLLDPHVAVPQGIDFDGLLEKLDDTELVFVNKLKSVYDQRPVWKRHSLLRLDGLGDTKLLTKFLSKLAYKVRAGPFGGCYILRGYDPRHDPQSARYQALNYTLSSTDIKLLKESLRGKTNIWVRGSPLQMRSNTQLCDIRDKQIREWVKAHVVRRYDLRLGWFTDQQLSQFREQISKVIGEIIKELREKDGMASLVNPSLTTKGNCPPIEDDPFTITVAPTYNPGKFLLTTSSTFNEPAFPQVELDTANKPSVESYKILGDHDKHDTEDEEEED
eukprot:CAMPEP_0203762838 /NCGR_PEP_ID=MMETSP0098-20131031/15635_1 /ASSEMBLY_ACC=CAM_ASM_000208 /TAXON_ID=96639 /ORGANISM=" , Strain NY0313808BC1" /LENGTH=625 /DNA_ID=CAMNT_0050657401 /DNA_START=143 /DNA_END=2017 /DNA_ORIENTATION=+